MQLEHEFTYRSAVIGPHVVGDGPSGLRHYYEIGDGVIEGARRAHGSMAAPWDRAPTGCSSGKTD